MLNQARWSFEKEMMRKYFPSFTPFTTESGWVGFFGCLKGPRSRRRYQVVLKAMADNYPQTEPAIYMEPRPERHHWISATAYEREHGGKLCYQRERGVWMPAQLTFANCLLIAIKYVAEFDR
jgi:hypothetical protein